MAGMIVWGCRDTFSTCLQAQAENFFSNNNKNNKNNKNNDNTDNSRKKRKMEEEEQEQEVGAEHE